LDLTVVQDGDQASYTDTENGSYAGTICGVVLTYKSGGPTWTESGRVVLEGADSASRRSRFEVDCCSSDRVDTPTRAGGG